MNCYLIPLGLQVAYMLTLLLLILFVQAEYDTMMTDEQEYRGQPSPRSLILLVPIFIITFREYIRQYETETFN